MRVKRTGKVNNTIITFGERTEDAKINKIQSLKTNTKLGKQIASGIYGKKGYSSVNVRKVIVSIKGGYSKSSIYRKGLLGEEADKYYYFAFPSSEGTHFTPKHLYEHIANSMKSFEQLSPNKKSGSTPNVAPPRISEINIDFYYHD